jgi:hypothetical protein
MPQMGFEPTIPVFEQVKTIHALDTAATVIGSTLPIGQSKGNNKLNAAFRCS